MSRITRLSDPVARDRSEQVLTLRSGLRPHTFARSLMRVLTLCRCSGPASSDATESLVTRASAAIRDHKGRTFCLTAEIALTLRTSVALVVNHGKDES